MQELIKVTTDVNGKQVVSARELYDTLTDNAGNFTRWASDNIKNNSFAFESIDYQRIMHKAENGRVIEDFVLTTDMAKKLCMLSKTQRGDNVRAYFIDAEKALMQITIPKTLSEALYLAAKQAETIEQQAEQLKLQEPKVEFAEQLLSATNSLDFGTSCKALQLPFGRNRMFEICRELGFLMENNQPYQSYVNSGYFTLLETSFIHPKSGDRVLTTKTMITAKGQNWLMGVFKKNGLM
jgi:anti-repressor protein